MKIKLLLLISFIFFSNLLYATGGTLAGDGSDATPYLVADYADLKKVATAAPYTRDKVYRLLNDIDATASAGEDTGKGFKPIGLATATAFIGKFYGAGHTITNLSINRPTSSNVGLFGVISTNAIVDSVTLSNSYIKGKEFVGGIVGYCLNSSVRNCTVIADSIIATQNYTGGIVGKGETATIQNNVNDATIKAVDYVGGIVAYSITNTNIIDCSNTGSLIVTNYGGGIAGYTNGGSIFNCINFNPISGNNSIGGIVGSCINTTISNTMNLGDISGNTRVGGFSGNAQGGLITDTYSTGAINGVSFVGGFVGFAQNSNIQDTYTIGDVVGSTASIGGFVGQNFGSIIDSSYCAGRFSGNLNSGGFAGTHISGSFTACYYNSEIAQTSTDIGYRFAPTPTIKALSIKQMQDSASIDSLNYASVWSVRKDSTYPTLNALDNAPFANNDTVRVSASALLNGVNIPNFLLNDFDKETIQDSLVYKYKTIQNGTTNWTSKIYFLANASNGDMAKLTYRIGEKNASLPDTLWGNTGQIIALMENTAPAFTQNSYTTNEDSITNFVLHASDADGDPVSYSALNSPIHGAASVHNDTLTYQPELNYNGLDSLQVICSDGISKDTVWMHIQLLPVNDAPIARDTLVYGVAGLPFKMKLPISDVDDTIFRGESIKSGDHGGESITSDSISYVSNPFYIGNDTILWFAYDSVLPTDTAMFIISLVAPEIQISNDSINFRAAGGQNKSILVISNTHWTSITTEPWVKVSPSASQFNDSLLVETEENLETTPRMANIYIETLGDTTKVINITQLGKIILDVVNPQITLNKVYDGTDTAKFTIDSILNIEPQDIGKVNIIPTAGYYDALVEENKTVWGAYTLTGTEKANYYVNDFNLSLTGSITPKQLTVSSTMVSDSKMVDGNITAQVLDKGILSGVETIDLANVQLQASANYEDASTGINKKIIIEYTLSGSAANNYIKPLNDTIYSGRILDYITINTLTDSLSSCDGESILLDYAILTGEASEYRIVFDAEAIAAGFNQSGYQTAPVGSNGTISLDIPTNAPSGKYTGGIQFRNDLLAESVLYPFTFYINIPASKINIVSSTVLLIDTTSLHYNALQWYKNDIALLGENDVNLLDMDGFTGNYQVAATLSNGASLYTCPKNIDSKSETAKYARVYPNPVRRNSDLTIELSDTAEIETQSAEIFIYDPNGKLISKSKTNQAKNIIQLDKLAGMYIVRIVLENGKEQSINVLVTN